MDLLLSQRASRLNSLGCDYSEIKIVEYLLECGLSSSPSCKGYQVIKGSSGPTSFSLFWYKINCRKILSNFVKRQEIRSSSMRLIQYCPIPKQMSSSFDTNFTSSFWTRSPIFSYQYFHNFVNLWPWPWVQKKSF